MVVVHRSQDVAKQRNREKKCTGQTGGEKKLTACIKSLSHFSKTQDSSLAFLLFGAAR